MCTLDLRNTDEAGLPRLLHLILTPVELDYIRIGIIGNMAAGTGDVVHTLTHLTEFQEFVDEHENVTKIHDAINLKIAPLIGLAKCPKCEDYHNPNCEAHNERCDGLKGVTL